MADSALSAPDSTRVSSRPVSRPRVALPRRPKAPQFSDLRTLGVFERIEDKFFVSRQNLASLEGLLQSRMRPSYLDPRTTFCGVESIYLDSTPQKVVRGSRPTKTVLLELKSKIKEGEVSRTRKLRFSLGSRDYEQLMKGKTLKLVPRLLRLNEEIPTPELLDRFNTINGLIRKHALKPVCKVSYVRRAFELPGLRVTFDDKIAYETLARSKTRVMPAGSIQSEKQQLALRMAQSFKDFDGVVLEIKHGGEIPEWLTSFLAETKSPKMSFSKYCYSMTEQLFKNEGITT
ncbi:VTC domain-containing protein [bacterium]|nr:VTC domain-containing protein [bacterium]